MRLFVSAMVLLLGLAGLCLPALAGSTLRCGSGLIPLQLPLTY